MKERQIQSVRGTQSIISGSEDGGRSHEPKNAGNLWNLGTTFGGQPTREEDLSPYNCKELNSANYVNGQGSDLSLGTPSKECGVLTSWFQLFETHVKLTEL